MRAARLRVSNASAKERTAGGALDTDENGRALATCDLGALRPVEYGGGAAVTVSLYSCALQGDF